MLQRLSPFLRTDKTTKKIMLDVIIALLPSVAVGVWFFGLKALYLTLVSVGACIATEALCRVFAKKEQSVADLSCIVTGLLLAMNMSSLTPIWVVAAAAVFSIGVVKQFFGGIGSNVVNPALMGRLFVMLVYPAKLMTYAEPLTDEIASATVLSGGSYELIDMIIGKIPGALGETSAVALIIGFLWLVLRKDVNPLYSAVYLVVTVALTTVFGMDPLTSLFAGGLILGGCFMLTDYPAMSNNSKLVTAIAAAVLTALIRSFTPYPEGVCYAILITNCLGGLIDKFVVKKIYGVSK